MKFQILLSSFIVGSLIVEVNSTTKQFSLNLEKKTGRYQSTNFYRDSIIQKFKTSTQSPSLAYQENSEQRNLQSSSQVINLQEGVGMIYTGTLFIGSQRISEKVLIDTEGEWLAIPLNNCTTCQNTNYNTSHSSTCEWLDSDLYELQDDESSLLQITGTTFRDDACLSQNQVQCVTMSIFGIETSNGVNGTYSDGILGLSPNEGVYGNSFIWNLYIQNYIDQPVFSFYLGNEQNKKSNIIFGGVDTQYLGANNNKDGPKGFQNFQTVSSSYWQLNLTLANYGKKSILNPNISYTTIFDSASTFISIPMSDFTSLSQFIQEKADPNDKLVCENGVCSFGVTCNNLKTELKKIYFGFDENLKFTMPSSSYLMDSQNLKSGNGKCIVGIIGVSFLNESTYILGDAFLRNYYSSYNFANFSISLCPAIDSAGSIFYQSQTDESDSSSRDSTGHKDDNDDNDYEEGTHTEDKNESGISAGLKFCIVVFVIVVMGLLGYLIYRLYQKKKLQKLEKALEQYNQEEAENSYRNNQL